MIELHNTTTTTIINGTRKRSAGSHLKILSRQQRQIKSRTPALRVPYIQQPFLKNTKEWRNILIAEPPQNTLGNCHSKPHGSLEHSSSKRSQNFQQKENQNCSTHKNHWNSNLTNQRLVVDRMRSRYSFLKGSHSLLTAIDIRGDKGGSHHSQATPNTHTEQVGYQIVEGEADLKQENHYKAGKISSWRQTFHISQARWPH